MNGRDYEWQITNKDKNKENVNKKENLRKERTTTKKNEKEKSS